MASAQDLYLQSESPAQAPRYSAKDWMFDWWTGDFTERQRQYEEAQREYNAQKLLTKAEWEREDSYYQRLVNDLNKAGINPYYALNNSGISLGSSNGQDLYTTKGKSSKKDKTDLKLAGTVAAAIMLLKLLL